MLQALLYHIAAACTGGTGGISIIPTWYKYLDSETIGGKCNPVFAFPEDIAKILFAIFEILLFVGGIVAVVFVIVGGFQYLISQGEPDRAKAARGTIINAFIGLVITLLASGIVNLIARNI